MSVVSSTEKSSASLQRRGSQLICAGLLLLILLVVGGSALYVTCVPQKSKYVTVTGTVNFDGKPLPYASIRFVTSEGLFHTAEVVNGQFEVQGIRRHQELKMLVTTSASDVEAKVSNFQAFDKVARETMSIEGHPFDPSRAEKAQKEFKEYWDSLRKKSEHYRFIAIPSRYGEIGETPFAITARMDVEKVELELETP